MIWSILLVLLVLWLLGMISSYTLGMLFNLLLVLSIITVLIRVIQGRRVAQAFILKDSGPPVRPAGMSRR